MFRRQYIHSVQIGTYACPDIRNEPTKLVVTFQLIIILLPVQFGSNQFQTGSDYLRNLSPENRTEQRTERTRTEQNRTFGSVLSVLVLWISSELNFGNTTYTTLCTRFLNVHKSRREAHTAQQFLSPTLENVLVKWIKHLGATGRPLSKHTIKVRAQH